jgi:3',5'-cyclic AMP phosphodiesterase CpdA
VFSYCESRISLGNHTPNQQRDRSALKSAIKHFTIAPAPSPTKLTRFLSFLRQHKETLDGVIITGDIATTGRIFDLQKAFTVIKDRIEPIGVDLCLLPGNHDRWMPSPGPARIQELSTDFQNWIDPLGSFTAAWGEIISTADGYMYLNAFPQPEDVATDPIFTKVYPSTQVKPPKTFFAKVAAIFKG